MNIEKIHANQTKYTKVNRLTQGSVKWLSNCNTDTTKTYFRKWSVMIGLDKWAAPARPIESISYYL